jgi:hypothetical protein
MECSKDLTALLAMPSGLAEQHAVHFDVGHALKDFCYIVLSSSVVLTSPRNTLLFLSETWGGTMGCRVQCICLLCIQSENGVEVAALLVVKFESFWQSQTEQLSKSLFCVPPGWAALNLQCAWLY